MRMILKDTFPPALPPVATAVIGVFTTVLRHRPACSHQVDADIKGAIEIIGIGEESFCHKSKFHYRDLHVCSLQHRTCCLRVLIK